MNAVFESVKALKAHCEIKVSIEGIESSFKIPAGRKDEKLREVIKTLTPVAEKALGLEGRDVITAYGLSLHKGGKVMIYCHYETPEDGTTSFPTPRLTPEHYDFELAPLVTSVTNHVKAVALAAGQVSLFEAAQQEDEKKEPEA